MATELLKFSPGKGNAKLAVLGGKVYTFSLLSGWTCPGADTCLAKVVTKDGAIKLEDGPNKRFRCFSAQQEAAFTAVRNQRSHNFEMLRNARTTQAMRELIEASLPQDATIIRIHVGGDFFNKNYMAAWVGVALNNPQILFYAYTKSLNYWVELFHKPSPNSLMVKNLKLTASKGGRHDKLIDEYGLKYAEVVFTEQEAKDKGLEIDHDDTHAFMSDKSFGLLLHGAQPKDSEAAKALKALKGVGSYSKTKKPTDGTKRKRRVLESTSS